MSIGRTGLCVLVTVALLGGALVFADGAERPIRFAAPKRILAGEAFLGAGRLFPSPVLHDVDGDGRKDIVVGDLFGAVTFAPRSAADGPPAFGAEKPLLDREAKPLRFHNW